MEQEHFQPEAEKRNRLLEVTPLSKYLAMFLFVIMPFIGGWIGYQYAPEKVVEVEKIVTKEVIEEVSLQKDEDNLNTFTNDFYQVSFVLSDGLTVEESNKEEAGYYSAHLTTKESGESLLRYIVFENSTTKTCYEHLNDLCFLDLKSNVDLHGTEWEHLGGYYFSDAGLSESMHHVYRKEVEGYIQYLTTNISLHEQLTNYPEIQQMLSTLSFSTDKNTPY